MMIKYFTAFIVVFILTLNAPAQESTPADESESAEDTEAAEQEPVDDEEVDDADLDDQTYEEDDDDFVPTEEIPADEPIPFPTNI